MTVANSRAGRREWLFGEAGPGLADLDAACGKPEIEAGPRVCPAPPVTSAMATPSFEVAEVGLEDLRDALAPPQPMVARQSSDRRADKTARPRGSAAPGRA